MPGRAEAEKHSDEDLVERVQRGEPRMFAGLVARYQDPVYGMALRFLRDPVEAEDLAQEAFLRAYRGLDRFKGEARFSTWLYRITWNLCADWLRAHRRPGRIPVALEETRELADGRVDLEQGLIDREQQRGVEEALQRLDLKYRSVVELLYFQKLSYEEIAAVLKVPLKTVETRLYRARRQLRADLERAGPGGAT